MGSKEGEETQLRIIAVRSFFSLPTAIFVYALLPTCLDDHFSFPSTLEVVVDSVRERDAWKAQIGNAVHAANQARLLSLLLPPSCPLALLRIF